MAMYEVMVLDPQKLRQARGQRTLEEVAAATGNVFSMQQISGYEKGKYRPRPEKLPILLKALGVEFFHVATYISPQGEPVG
jgi:transcriptional regulator with XRE-family HTH domain